jgi:hypothetical protein
MEFSIPPHGIPSLEGDASWICADGVVVEGKELPPLFVRLGVGADGGLVATGILIDADGELPARALRLPLARIVGEFIQAASRPAIYKRLRRELFAQAKEDPREVEWRPTTPEGEPAWFLAADFVSVRTRERPVPRWRTGRRGYPPEHYRRIAKAYERAKRMQPRAPIRALMKELSQTEPTVHRWLRKARELGYLKGDKP